MFMFTAVPMYLFKILICPMRSPFSLPALRCYEHFHKCFFEPKQSAGFQLSLIKLPLRADLTMYSSSLFQILPSTRSLDGLDKSLKASTDRIRHLLPLLSWSVLFIFKFFFVPVFLLWLLKLILFRSTLCFWYVAGIRHALWIANLWGISEWLLWVFFFLMPVPGQFKWQSCT